LTPAGEPDTESQAVRLSILIPAYHEELTIGDVVRLTRHVELEPLGIDKEIIVCDDGSRDQTSAEVERAAGGDPRVILLRHERNRGKGAAIRTALGVASGEIALVQDADLEYSVGDYRALLEPMLAGADVVYGSRFLTRSWPEGMHLANFVANKLLTGASNLLYHHHITDEATCFKVFRTQLLRELDLECEGFEFCPEVTSKLGLRRVRIVEVPIRYSARSAAAGKKVRWTDGLKAMQTLVRYRLGKKTSPSASAGTPARVDSAAKVAPRDTRSPSA
jgi:glycosyltransferase involved in cell wall biosynthesis